MNLAHLLFSASKSFPDHPAVSIGDRPIYDFASYGGLAAHLAAAMNELWNLRPGDRVALAMTNNAEYLAVLFAIWRAGLVAVPVNAKLHPREIAFIASDCEARLCIASPDLAGPLVTTLAPASRLLVLHDSDWRRSLASPAPSRNCIRPIPPGYSTPAARPDVPRARCSAIAISWRWRSAISP